MNRPTLMETYCTIAAPIGALILSTPVGIFVAFAALSWAVFRWGH